MMLNREKLTGLLGLARRAGKLAAGSDAVENGLRHQKVQAIILAEDAARSTTEKFEKASAKHGVPLLRALSRDELGKLMGRETLAVLGVNDPSFAQAIALLKIE